MITFLTAFQIFCSLLIVALVLLQPSKEGAGAFANTQSGPMGNAAGSTPLFKITMFLGVFVMLTSIIVSRAKIQEAKTSAVDELRATDLKKTDSEPVTDLTQTPAKSTTTDASKPTTSAPEGTKTTEGPSKSRSK